MVEKQYTNGEITVIWKPDLCIHSTNCWRGLNAVFDPKKRPWINLEAATSEAIIAQVEQCPSGALSYVRNAETPVMPESLAPASVTEIELMPNGPMLVRGPVRITRRNGETKEVQHTVALCRCGGSKSKPFCDGTHSGNGFKDE